MANSVLLLATLGGFISFLSTGLGALLSYKRVPSTSFFKFKFSIDFALGLMISVVAFSLVGPTAMSSFEKPYLLIMNFGGFVFGGLLIYSLKGFIEKRPPSEKSQNSSSQLLLALALIVHNFPEGLASGASLAGLDLRSASSILLPIALQNVPEGLLMVLCLRAMGWSQQRAFLGGVASGLVELIGGVMAGVALSWISGILPILLMVAGGAMFVSVCIEVSERGSLARQILKPEFAVGLILVPMLNSFVG